MKTSIKTDLINNWSEINWKPINKSVIKLRKRIFDAKKNDKGKSVKNLQALMLKSTANILYSIRKVSYTSTKSTPGIDSEVLKNSQDKLRLFMYISSNSFKKINPNSIKRIYLEELGKLKPINIPTVCNKVLECMVCNSLEPEWKAIFKKSDYSSRLKKDVKDVVNTLLLELNKPSGRKWVIESNISKYPYTVLYSYILEALKGFPGKALIKKMLNTGIIVKHIWLLSNEEFTIQKSFLSSLLCDIIFYSLEQELESEHTEKNYVVSKRLLVVRFLYNFVILCSSKKDAVLTLRFLRQFFLKKGFWVSDLRTKIVHIVEGFDFLDFNFRMRPKKYLSYNSTILDLGESNYKIFYDKVFVCVSPSKRYLLKIKSKLKQVLCSTKGTTAEEFITKLNFLIQRYSHSKFHWYSNSAFNELDRYLYTLCWRWAIRKHPQKGYKWIKSRYFFSPSSEFLNNKWIFCADSVKTNNVGSFNAYTNLPFFSSLADSLHSKIFLYKFRWFYVHDYGSGNFNGSSSNDKT